MALTAGTVLGGYEILAPLGAGGMGEVYRARHARLGRDAALKVLPADVAADPGLRRRFEAEARAASALNHPAIVTIYDVGETRGTTWIAMELVEGRTLRARLGDGPLGVAETLALACRIADGLARAHAAGIVHRDLKPENVMLLPPGGVKILDFGLAKRAPEPEAGQSTLTTVTPMTRAGELLGTVHYMSPEQAAGREVDHRSDQFSFGVVLYEMLGGTRPFDADSVAGLLSAILRDDPPPLQTVRPGIPRGIDDVIRRCLQKDPARRFASTDELREALVRCQAETAARAGRRIGARAAALLLAAALVAAGALAAWAWRDEVVRWMERDRIAEIERQVEAGALFEAFRLAHAVGERLPGDARVRALTERITIPISIVTEPAGAEVRIRGYASSDSQWVRLGTTPLEGVRVPYALAEWRITRDGYEPFEGAPYGIRPFMAFGRGFPLDPDGTRPPGMVRVPGGPYERNGFPAVRLDDYWIDRHEVTHREFKGFVDAGGYTTAAYWQEPFVEDGRTLRREEAMRRFVDRTGRPGPAGWAFGVYDEGEAGLPAGGVSWYEAAAYCRFAGKRLPTLFHWSAAGAQDQFSDIVRVSNFGGDGPAPVGSLPGLGDFGTYDMAGNVKEWVWNGAAAGRYILGGAWNEPAYTYRIDADAQPPMSRALTHGFRCMKCDTPPDAPLLARHVPSYFATEAQPVSDAVFEAYRRMYAYDRTPLDAVVESVDESSPHWRMETVSFDAAYGGERVLAHVFLPRGVTPPYQPVLWFPGNDAFLLPAGSGLASPYLFDFIPRTGRALIYPVYKGMYERHLALTFAPNEWRDMMVLWSKDLGRTIDYLEQRGDMDTGRLAYYGFSAGAVYGPVFTAVDDRFAASVLLAGGLMGEIPPEANALHFAPRSRVPTLMINGHDDYLLPYEAAQRPLFARLGAPAPGKRHERLEGGHIPADRLALMGAVLAWLDRHLGPVRSGPPG